MLKYCDRLETGDKKEERIEYEKIVLGIKEWYIKQHAEFEQMLKHELLKELSEKILDADVDGQSWQEYLSIKGFSDNWQAKLNLFSASDIMCKQLLSKYTYGPDASIPVDFTKSKGSWLDSKLNVYEIYELLQFQLSAHKEGQKINLSALMEERETRSNLTHSGRISVCLSAIRCYNILREMIILMDDEAASELPRFTYPSETECDMQRFLEYTNGLNFADEHTLLIAGSLHDISAEGKGMLANLPWTVVLDFDGYSSFGGLRSGVSHNNIHDQKMTLDTASHYSPLNGYTTWFTCGEFCDYTFTNTSRDACFKTRTPFETDYYSINDKLSSIFHKLLSVLSQQLKPINIVFVHDDPELAKRLLGCCARNFSQKQYTFTCLYYHPKDVWDNILARLQPSRRGATQRYSLESLSCDLDSFFAGLLDYRTAFPKRETMQRVNMLPSEDGLKTISNNTSLNLSQYFDVIYSDSGSEDAEEARQKINTFYHGGSAPWCAFKRECIVPLLQRKEYDRYLEKVRENLRRIPEKAAQKIINIVHEPGIGGSTLLRKIGWDLHLEYPVLLIHTYDSKIGSLVMQLYDELKVGVLILADESISEIDKLKEDVRKLPRACSLVVAGRINSLVPGKNEQSILFKAVAATVTESSEAKLPSMFKEYSELTSAEKRSKDQNYIAFVSQHMTMHYPFMIGLYYLDKNFNGVNDYVDRIMSSVSDRREIEIVAIVALCDYYGQVGLPRVLVENYLGLPPRTNYLLSHAYSSSVFIAGTDYSDVPVYRSKHYIISQRLLEKCCDRLYNSTLANSLSILAEQLISIVHAECAKKYSYAYQELLERLFIDNSYNHQNFSKLILDIVSPVSRKHVLEILAEKFGDLAERNAPEEAEDLYRMASHFYGHLGRLCSKRDGGVENVEDARKYGKKAVELMELASPERPDALIYHMYGDACRHCLRKQLDEHEGAPTPDEYESFEDTIDEIRDVFDLAATFGSEDFSCVSKLGMYIMYLKKVYAWKKITNAEHISKLSVVQANYREEIESLLNVLSDLPINDDTREMYYHYENEYRSDIMMNDYSAAIQYYENRLANLDKTPGRDMEKQDARRGLISIRMARFYGSAENNEDVHVEMEARELTRVLDLLEQTLGQTIDPGNYRQRNQRIGAYSRWFQLAKMKGANRPVHTALLHAQRWHELVEQANLDDPRPSYYLYVLSALSLLDNNKASKKDMEIYRKRTYELARKTGYRTDSIKDVLVDGTGLSRLLDMRYAKNPVKYLESAKAVPMICDGTFETTGGGKGQIRIHAPSNWAGESIRFTLGTVDRSNTIGERQLSHKLSTFVGFSFEQLEAVNKYVRDLSANEEKPQLEKGDKKTVKSKANANEPANISLRSNQGFTEYRAKFTANEIRGSALGGWVNGKVDGIRAGVSISDDLMRFGSEQIERKGGMQNILQLLLRKDAIPCVVKDQVEDRNGIRYKVSLFEACSSLDDLFNEPVVLPQASKQESKKDDADAVSEVPIKNGKVVSVRLNRQELQRGIAFGSFQHDDSIYNIEIKLKNKKDKDAIAKALRTDKKIINVRIISQKAAGNYSGQLQ